MKSVIASFAVAVLAGLVDAKASFTNTEFDIVAGQSYTLKWEGGAGPYTINLKDGPSNNLETVETLISSTTADSATITLPSTLTSGTYAFEIIDISDNEPNYSVQFPFLGSAASSTITTSATASSTKVSSSSATSTSTLTSASTTASSSSASSSASTTGSASTTVSTSTTSSSSTRTSSSASASTTAASVNGAGKAAFAPLALVAGVVLAAL
ncbi:hypothetical protein BKA67DRAFT_530243 [Truncatella angustata]|uniref:Yeast cell wall synthesis Kre9/Knh1-like N-terminal domain-containing protein n=1 Tax=Truncatella angustata TaxID=152316 RepID=A0A9P8UXN8_9PEZI|nr:uncharacterized protein BKA67DRAFT_530243 [Truncatella angustata]KAH6660127.1 hypothetical protein BKA67DRAFT_530243 [Truncatella angustata]KAH8202609.1 hypothetical protein TruAng_003210 [Truncatella angustata]